MSRTSDIVASVRDILADNNSNNYRYTDASILSYINKGIKDINNKLNVLKGAIGVRIEDRNNFYTLKDKAIKILRVEYKGNPLSLMTDSELDTMYNDWEAEIGAEPKYITFSNLPQNSFKIVPSMETSVGADYNSLYGGLIDISLVPTFAYTFIDISEIAESNDEYLVVSYVKKHTPVTLDTLDENFELDDMYDDALIFYTSGMILRTDIDSQNRQFSSEQLTLYTAVLNSFKPKASNNYSGVKTTDVSYKGFR